MIAIGKGCDELRCLCLSGCVQLTDKTLSELGQHCTNLVTLEVAKGTHFSDRGFKDLVKVICHRVQCLSLWN